MGESLSTVLDTLQPLAKIRRTCANQPLATSLLALTHSAAAAHNLIDDLECLYLSDDIDDHGRNVEFVPPAKRRRGLRGVLKSPSPALRRVLRRRHLDPSSGSNASRDYVAVSYTWEPSSNEDKAIGSYAIEARDHGPAFLESEVRDVVWDRVLRFADNVKCPNIWVDRECIDQGNQVEKQAAMQSMHLVYSLSRCPVALLTCRIASDKELALLANLMRGDVPAEDEEDTFHLLEAITSDPWWNRAWTFQEDYRASIRMRLLIPHASQLEAQKRQCRSNKGLMFGTIEGEIVLKSVDFKRQTTRFCLAYQKQHGSDIACKEILETSGKYTELLKAEARMPGQPSITRSMSPTIFADVGKRGITNELDRLAIIANCCGYDTRLNTITLSTMKDQSSSLSLSLLLLFLLNGEIMENDPTHELGSLNDTVFTFLSKQSLQSFRPAIQAELTFIKHCRFIAPELTPEGIITKGHLWSLGQTIRLDPLGDLEVGNAQILHILSTELQNSKHGGTHQELAEHIDEWLESSIAPSQETTTSTSSVQQHPSSRWREWMAGQVAQGIRDGKPLRFGTLIDPNAISDNKEETRQPSAIFVGDHKDDWEESDNQPKYVFTSFRWAQDSTEELDKHVSLEVRTAEEELRQNHCDEKRKDKIIPSLYIDRWVNGLCFFAEHVRQEVIFPLPRALME